MPEMQAGNAAEKLPHVHPDHALGVALERMGSSGYKVLPVVSRTDVRHIEGVVTLDDILEAYRVKSNGGEDGDEQWDE
jgi:CBS domain-containing protein